MRGHLLARGLLIFAIATITFCWGFLAHRNRIFPYHVLYGVAVQGGLAEPQPAPRYLEVEPRSEHLDLLRALPYVASSFDPNHERRGVLTHEPDEALAGYNFYNATRGNTAQLIDMDGRVVHRWSYDYGNDGWHHAELLPNGDILVVVNDKALLRLDKDSNLIWAFEARVHHDVWVLPSEEILCIVREPVKAEDIHPQIPILMEKIVRLSQHGVKLEEILLDDPIRRSPYTFLLPNVADQVFPEHINELDIFHANHIEAFDGSQEHRSALFERGNLLVSFKHLNAVIIIDGSSKDIIWMWGPNNLSLQHQPTLLEEGRLLIFDNGTRASRVLELDPLSLRIVWSYENDEDFFTFWGGGNQRLPNGNTVITETARGYAFEVTPDGDVVWEFANPEVDSEGQRQNIWRMVRIDPKSIRFLK